MQLRAAGDGLNDLLVDQRFACIACFDWEHLPIYHPIIVIVFNVVVLYLSLLTNNPFYVECQSEFYHVRFSGHFLVQCFCVIVSRGLCSSSITLPN
jgi:hypothetical protein